MQVDQVIEHAHADIGDKALADPRDQIETRKGAHSQRQHQDKKQPDRLIQRSLGLRGQALIHQQADALPHGQRNSGGKHQRQQRPQHLPTIRGDKAASHAQGTATTGRQGSWHNEHPANGLKRR